MMRCRAWLMLSLLALPCAMRAEEPAVARPVFSVGTEQLGPGTAFFLDVGPPVGTVAVTTAHAFEVPQLAAAGVVRFVRGRTGIDMSLSKRLLAHGRPFAADGAELRGDYLVFALDAQLTGGRALRASSSAVKGLAGRRVRILGVPAQIAHDEDDLFGTVRDASRERIEVALDVRADLRGWGGAPVVLHPDGDVIGILEAAWPDAGTLRLGVAPIGGVLDALKSPLAGGMGLDFAQLDPEAARARSGGGAASRSTADERKDASGSIDSQLVLADPPAARGAGEPLLGRAGALSTNLVVEVEYPGNDAVVGEPEGFVAGRALAMLGEFKRFDVVLVIDTSLSTHDSSGADVNGNGIVGRDRAGGLFGSTDGGDSILAAEVAAAMRVVDNLDPRNTRVAVVTFAGEEPPPPGVLVIGRRRPDAMTEEPLTSDFVRVKKALQNVYRRGPDGNTNMTAGVRLAIRELKGFRGAISTPDPESEKVVLFFTDGQPTLPYVGSEFENTRTVMRAAGQARRAHVKVHTFAIGPQALEGPVAAVELAEISGGYFTPVRHPGDLVEVIENVSFANIKTLTVTNLTLDEPALELVANADGTFGALVKLKTGKNRIRVHAVAMDGTEAEAVVTIAHAPDVESPDIPKELIGARNRLLERRLVTLKRGRIEVEHEAAEKVRQELQIEIERERKAATERAARQRRDLQLEVEREEAIHD